VVAAFLALRIGRRRELPALAGEAA